MSRKTTVQCDFCKSEITGHCLIMKETGGIIVYVDSDFCNWRCARKYLNAIYDRLERNENDKETTNV